MITNMEEGCSPFPMDKMRGVNGKMEAWSGITTVFVCEDSMEGILSGVYQAYASKLGHNHCRLTTNANEYELFSTYREVETSMVLAKKVSKTLLERLGEEVYWRICLAMSSYEEDKAEAVYKTIVIGLAMQNGFRVLEHLTNPYVCRVFQMQRNAGFEFDHMRGFLRFQEMESGVLVAQIHPKNNLLVYLAPHFSDRLPQENFLIYDEKRKIAAIHEKEKQWYIVQGEELDTQALGNISEAEAYYQNLFWHFCHSISIDSRKNINLQRQMLPLRFRDHMPEFSQR